MSTDVQEKPQTPFEFLAQFPGTPSEEDVTGWQAAAPGGRVRLFTPDRKRIFIVRAIGALELEKIQQSLLNIPQERLATELQRMVCVQATLWTNTTKSGKLSSQDLQAAPAGLAPTMHEVVSELSDFLSPQLIEQLTIDF